jgi:hypothetical protein
MPKVANWFVSGKLVNGQKLPPPYELFSIEGHDFDSDDELYKAITGVILCTLHLSYKLRVQPKAVDCRVPREESPSSSEISETLVKQVVSFDLDIAEDLIKGSQEKLQKALERVTLLSLLIQISNLILAEPERAKRLFKDRDIVDIEMYVLLLHDRLESVEKQRVLDIDAVVFERVSAGDGGFFEVSDFVDTDGNAVSSFRSGLGDLLGRIVLPIPLTPLPIGVLALVESLYGSIGTKGGIFLAVFLTFLVFLVKVDRFVQRRFLAM